MRMPARLMLCLLAVVAVTAPTPLLLTSTAATASAATVTRPVSTGLTPSGVRTVVAPTPTAGQPAPTNQPQPQTDAADVRRKAAFVAAIVVLLALVYAGRRYRYKNRMKQG